METYKKAGFREGRILVLEDGDRQSAEVIYDGPIRAGGPGSEFEDGFKVKRLKRNGLVFLDPIPDGVDDFYDEDDYWPSRYGSGEGIDFGALWEKLGREQSLWLDAIGVEEFVDRSVVDVGAGAGLFLDRVLGTAKETIGIEPSFAMRERLQERGHQAQADLSFLSDESVDLCVSFDTLEHVLNPLAFLRKIFRVMRGGGRVFIGVPNQNDFLKELCPAYLPFFYHKSHLYYFTAQVLEELLTEAGFHSIERKSVHKYNFKNMVKWLREGKPSGVSDGHLFDGFFEDTFRREIERRDTASHILLKGEKPD